LKGPLEVHRRDGIKFHHLHENEGPCGGRECASQADPCLIRGEPARWGCVIQNTGDHGRSFCRCEGVRRPLPLITLELVGSSCGGQFTHS
jgi:hypothetical protein